MPLNQAPWLLLFKSISKSIQNSILIHVLARLKNQLQQVLNPRSNLLAPSYTQKISWHLGKIRKIP
jgi:hypothetical protein